MRISEQTIQTLKSQGITVRWFPENTLEEFEQRVWKETYSRAYNYTKDNVAGSEATQNGLTNVLYNSVEELEKHCRQYADIWYKHNADPYEYDTLYVTYDGYRMIMKKEPVKSKAITIDYIEKLVVKDRKAYQGTYGQFAIAMQNICKQRGLANHFFVYPTTYGVGVWVIYNFNADEHIERVSDIMKERGIEYYNEYSEHRWVYRFKVSKKRENLERMKA